MGVGGWGWQGAYGMGVGVGGWPYIGPALAAMQVEGMKNGTRRQWGQEPQGACGVGVGVAGGGGGVRGGLGQGECMRKGGWADGRGAGAWVVGVGAEGSHEG